MIPEISEGVIVHQVNCRGTMGCGLALEIRRRWPIVFETYRKYRFEPGMVQFVRVGDRLWVCNLAGQDGFGRDRQYTIYSAVRVGLVKIRATADRLSVPVYIPIGMGCRNAGGNWWEVLEILEDVCPGAILF